MQTIIVASIACLIFAIFLGILMIKGRKKDQPVKWHLCGQEDGCQCTKKGESHQQKGCQA